MSSYAYYYEDGSIIVRSGNQMDQQCAEDAFLVTECIAKAGKIEPNVRILKNRMGPIGPLQVDPDETLSQRYTRELADSFVPVEMPESAPSIDPVPFEIWSMGRPKPLVNQIENLRKVIDQSEDRYVVNCFVFQFPDNVEVLFAMSLGKGIRYVIEDGVARRIDIPS